jgi:hypothetical protein
LATFLVALLVVAFFLAAFLVAFFLTATVPPPLNKVPASSLSRLPHA